jgi:hypothetical protein
MKACTKTRFVGCYTNVLTMGPRVAVGLLAVTIGLATVSVPLHVAATPICASSALRETNATVYLFDASDTPVLEPDASVLEGGVYTNTGFIGTVDSDFNILDANDNIIGYVTYPSPS